jgi:leader peptidase (prepilin peptidase) / N-methyltransferase
MGLIWGSFLNVLAHRLLHNTHLFTLRSHCPSCRHVIAWYDNIPLVSWVMLRGKCRWCKATISWLYPFVELATAVLITMLFYKITWVPVMIWDPEKLWFYGFAFMQSYQALGAYVIFISSLIASTRTDLEAMVIPQAFTLWLVPLGVLFAYLGVTNVSWRESIIGAVIGYGLLWVVAWIFKRATGKEGLGIGDMELLAMIGSFVGPIGVWISLMVGSISGLVIGGLYIGLIRKNLNVRIPFGPFLALGALVYFFLTSPLIVLLLEM